MARLNRIQTRAGFLLGGLVLCAHASAQQLVHNTTSVPSSSGYTENVDFADIDNDGDWDAAFAEGGDFGNQQNVLWQNQGGAQGGTVGVFTNVTTTQFPAVLDDSRDIEFLDMNADGDNDIYVSNTAQISNQSNRWWVNMGGAQGGTTGFFQDQTAAHWSNLGGAGSSIAPSQLIGGGFIDFSCDCDFADLDNDGDLDLFHSSYGGALGGNVPSRIFLNDGTGVFTEFNPSGFQLPAQNITNGVPGVWCQGTQLANTTNATGVNCDIASSALDIDLQDIDGDFDLDVLHGARQEAPRLFQNRFAENGNVLGFRDVTGSNLPAGYSTGNGHYEQEFADQDGDGDMDIYGLNWLVSFTFDDIVTKNNGSGVYAPVVTLSNSGSDDNEGDYFDYDNDGDLDLFVANFSGQDRVYQNNGTGTYTYMATGTVIPADGTTSLDADTCDVDEDGDEDVFVANDANQAEWYLQNTTTANDTFAPYLPRLEQAPNRVAGAAPTVVRFWVGDNHAYYIIPYYSASVDVSVNGGPVTTYPARTMWGQQFRCEIPGNLVGSVSYTAHCTDRYGNTGTSGSHGYTATAGGSSPMTSYCNPGVSGVNACPCGNPPTGTDRGCNNSSSTGGAQLSAIGTASLASDTVVFTSAGEKPTATSIVLQGDATNAAGVTFGQGIRCVAGSLKRLFTHNAVGGSMSAPVGADLSVSARSSALGDNISAGSTRYYAVYYRDPVVLGGCAGTSTFNLTQGGSIVWQP
ncbi:MAG: VCBS repeat-containing protein [Planctomycetes bacterium]|nr:VCBS repeat-containing protein [Planctomycetota bacterium]